MERRYLTGIIKSIYGSFTLDKSICRSGIELYLWMIEPLFNMTFRYTLSVYLRLNRTQKLLHSAHEGALCIKLIVVNEDTIFVR